MFLPNKISLSVRRGYLAPPVVIILALITLAVAATLLFQAKFFSAGKNPSPTPVAQASPNPTSKDDLSSDSSAKDLSTTETLVKEETANWKTYTNTKFGYLIMYPSDWSIEDGETILDEKTNYVVQSLLIKKDNNSKGSVSVNVNFQGDLCFGPDTTNEKIVISSYAGTKYSCFGKNESKLAYIEYVFKNTKGNDNYVIQGDLIEASENNIIIIQKILSTFRFTE